jgi:uncharacterized protein (TIGR02466 family)
MPCFSAFATPVFMEDLNPPAQVEREMLRFVENFHIKSKELGEHQANITGDVCDEFLLHKKPEFKWLNTQIGVACNEYLSEIGVALDKVNIYAEKSWPAICEDEGYIPTHAHKNAIISAVFYITEPLNNSGCLKFESDNCMDYLPLVFEDTDINYKEVLLSPVKNRLILFPGAFAHSVTPYYGEEPRYSVSYDLMIVSKTPPGSGNIENWVTDPYFWEAL